ncbi:MAG: IS4 family transposase [Candidatus Brocadiales bacterium]|nr:IS4 family transposase [Candidatus Brocadiales bacterium]
MDKRNLIKQKLAQPESIDIVKEILDDNPEASRFEIAGRVCEYFSFVNAVGEPQRSSCSRALWELEKAGKMRLPKPKTQPTRGGPRRLAEPVELPLDVPSRTDLINDLTLVRVEADTEVRIWNELMIQEHPRGAGPFVGAQIRYLIKSEFGWLGGFGFSASALQLMDRDQWIGWETITRRQNLDRIINLSRFLIRPSINCDNLASSVLGMALRLIGDDFELRYGYRPFLVETFVESSHHAGTCYLASNWIEVGKTKGRGRQDCANQQLETIKTIFLYQLENDFRSQMGIQLPVREALEIADGLDGDQWAENEFGGADLGDKRLTKRLIDSAIIKAANPMEAFCGAANGDWPKVKGFYRMIDKPDDDPNITMNAILAPHRERTVQRMMAHKDVLCIQDGTDLEYNSLSQCKGLGIIGTNQTSAQSSGLHLHSTMVVTTDGVPLGLLGTKCEAPEIKEKDEKPSSNRPIEEKKTFCWIESLRDSNALAKEMPSTRQICVMDREADFFESFSEPRHPQVELLVRAKHNRCTNGELKLFDTLRQSPVRSTLTIQIPRQSARPKRSKQKARPHRAKRMAQVELRYQQIELPPPSNLKDKASLKRWVVHIREETPPLNEEPLEWFILTTIDVTSNRIAEQCIRWYRLRWRIEDWHRVLKGGCGTEKLQHKTAERLKRSIAINMVIAWRIMLMTLLGRECPDLPAELLFSDIEIEVLTAKAEKKKKINAPIKLGDAVQLVAALAGYLGRKSDPPPGHQIMWKGYAYLQFLCDGYVLAQWNNTG